MITYTDSTHKVILLVFVTTLLSEITLAAPAGSSCVGGFQTKFEELMTLKQLCKHFTFKDCCQVRNSCCQ